MKRHFKGIILATVIIMVMVFALTMEAAALPVLDTDSVDMYLKANTFPDGLEEEMIFLIKDEGNVVWGSLGSNTNDQVVKFESSSDIDIADGFATIKGADNAYFHDLTISAPGFYFGDLLFDILMGEDLTGGFGADDVPLTVTANLSNGNSISYSGWNGEADWVPGLNDILVLAESGYALESITITSSIGIDYMGVDQVKHIQISELQGVPEPSAMFLLGTGLLGLVAARRKKIIKS